MVNRIHIREYWDTCLFLTYLKDKPEEKATVDVIDALLRRAQNPSNDVIVVVSTMVISEIRRYPENDRGKWDSVHDLLHTNRPYIKLTGVTPRIADLASAIGTDHRSLSPADSIHVATALSERASVLLTLDGSHEHGRRRNGDLLDFDGLIGNPPLAIKAPQMPLDTQLHLLEDPRK